ncbi:hypothetical protein NE237_024006 [Protea cynaroides]|uniref:Uncharacterized protein n=1 Tax=Protea cynaroides TaxID=273540 RepID=A0A9Q0K5Y3_9MAGN|nr:hypothetical protein NE237_024006 [Protea cynaroides]
MTQQMQTRAEHLSHNCLCNANDLFLKGGGNVDTQDRSKRENVRCSSNVGKGSSSHQDSEMGRGTEVVEELRQPPPTTQSTKKTKFFSKPFDECNDVDLAAVPRKRRSAINKRNREYMSSPLLAPKKLPDTSNGCHGIETPQINGAKKVKQPVLGPITKDEEEVVETLYALARMVPDNPVRHPVDDETLEAKSSPLPEAKESLVPTSEAPEEKCNNSPIHSNSAETNNLELLTRENPGGHTTLEQPFSTESLKFGLESNDCVTQADLNRVPLLSKTGEMQLCTTVCLRDPSELCPETGLVQPKQLDNHLPKRKTENMFWPVAGIAMNQQRQPPINGTKGSVTCLSCPEGGPILWPGLETARSCADGVHHSLEWPSSTKTPAWPDAATCSIRPSFFGNSVSTGKVSPIVERKQSWKRCVAHVCISHLIQTFQTAEMTSRCPIACDQLKEKQGMKSGFVANSNPTGLNGLKRVIFANNMNVSSTEKSLNEQRVGIPLEKRLQQDQKQTAITSGINASQNQNCNFLSLSSGHDGCEAGSNNNNNNNSNKNKRSKLVANGREQPTSFHVPYLHSIAQHHPLLPLSSPHPRNFSGLYPDELTVARQQVQLQLPQYLGSPFYGQPHLGHPDPEKQQQHRLPAHMWVAQLATQYRSMGIPGSHFPNWHNERLENTTLFIPCAKSIQPTTTPTSLEVELGSNALLANSNSSSFQAPMTRLAVGSSQLLCNAEHM